MATGGVQSISVDYMGTAFRRSRPVLSGDSTSYRISIAQSNRQLLWAFRPPIYRLNIFWEYDARSVGQVKLLLVTALLRCLKMRCRCRILRIVLLLLCSEDKRLYCEPSRFSIMYPKYIRYIPGIYPKYFQNLFHGSYDFQFHGKSQEKNAYRKRCSW